MSQYQHAEIIYSCCVTEIHLNIVVYVAILHGILQLNQTQSVQTNASHPFLAVKRMNEQHPSYSCVVSKDGFARTLGLLLGSRVLSVAGETNLTWLCLYRLMQQLLHLQNMIHLYRINSNLFITCGFYLLVLHTVNVDGDVS